MKFEMFSRVVLKTDVPENGLRCGDLATIVESHPGVPGQEPGYSLEVFNAVGDTVAVITLGESQIEPLREDEILCARVMAAWGMAFSAKSLHDYKFWPPVARVDNVFGDRNPVCSCVGMKNYS